MVMMTNPDCPEIFDVGNLFGLELGEQEA
jgi:hypothetical protein